MADSDLDDDGGLSMFQEPSSFRPASPKPTSTTYTMLNGSSTLHLNLIGSSPLWGHILWHTSTTLAGYLERNPRLVHGQVVLELGAGAGLPSLVAAILGAKSICVTDYPDADLIENLVGNVRNNQHLWYPTQSVEAEGYLWGSNASPCMKKMLDETNAGVDLMILSDLLFNHSEHSKLVATIKSFLRQPDHQKTPDSYPRALVFFTPHRPWLYEKDLAFFDLAREHGLIATKIFEEILDKPMFVEDRGDETMRRTVEGWELSWL